MKFIKLTTTDGESYYINAHKLEVIYGHKDGTTILGWGDNTTSVKETPEEIMILLNK